MIQLGKKNTLQIIRDTPVGMFLGEDDSNVVLLPKKFIEPEFKVGDEIDVFIYFLKRSRFESDGRMCFYVKKVA